MKLVTLLVAMVACTLPAIAQSDETAKSFHLLPHLADGGGWQSVLLVTNVSQSASRCTFNVYGVPLNRFSELGSFGTAAGSTATFQLEGPGGYLIWNTKNELAVASGYATLDCSAPVVAQVMFAWFGGSGEPTGMATVFSSQAGTVFQFPVLQPAATLGFAIANDTNAEASCRIVFEDGQRTNLGEATLSVPAKSNRAQMLHDAISIPGTFLGGSATVSCKQPVAMIGLHFELRPDGTISTFSTLPPAILSTTPVSPTKPFSQLQAERLIGTWVFSYTIISRFTDTYRLSDVQESPTTPGEWIIAGTGTFGDPVIAGYSPDLGRFSLLDPGTIIHKFFTFDFVGSNTVSGCYYQVDVADDSFSRCYDMTGVRTSSSTQSGLTRALPYTTAAQAESREIEEAKKLGDEMQIEVDPKIIRVLEDFREVLRQ